MRVLYVTGSCLTRNTSANISHNSFVQGLLENGSSVDIIMAEDSWGEPDSGLPIWKNAKYNSYPSRSFSDMLRSLLKRQISAGESEKYEITNEKTNGSEKGNSINKLVRSTGKKLFYKIFKPDPVYPLEKEWLKKASSFSNTELYDVVISNSSPAASHRLVVELKKKNRIHFDRWIQIWEDPWFHDIYGKYSSSVEREEHFLLQQASEIVYVSPLTLMYQKQYYPDCEKKMRSVPLPSLQIPEEECGEDDTEFSFGYFGDYYSEARNLKPFYDAAKATGFQCYIYGDSDLAFEKTDHIEISGRITLDKLQPIQDKTNAFVHLCNLKGGQIPGKIYHYSATRKPILFILDGTEEEQTALRHFFEPFNRYYFCKNTTEDICRVMHQIAAEKTTFPAVGEFSPKEVVKELLCRKTGE